MTLRYTRDRRWWRIKLINAAIYKAINNSVLIKGEITAGSIITQNTLNDLNAIDKLVVTHHVPVPYIVNQ